ncbi:MAG: universal stress protein [Burkholderiales bacterium]
MNYKTIVVHMDRSARRAQRLDIALDMARTHDAHLVGLFALSTPRIPSYALAEAGSTVLEQLRLRQAEQAAEAEAEFRKAAARHGVSTVEWRVSRQDAVGAACLSARYADLLIAGQPEPADAMPAGIAAGFHEELLLSTGGPVLFVPYAGRFERVGQRVLVAWDAGREAARAVSDALPLLARAAHVEVVVFDPEKSLAHGDVPGADISLYLARHGVKASAAQLSGAGMDVGNQILSRAADLGSDLIVMGGYGHSRMRELMLGGATRTVLETMTVPVLMSH